MSTDHRTFSSSQTDLSFSFFPRRVGVSGIRKTFPGENGSSSVSGLVALPSNDVGLVVNVSAEENDESDLSEHSEVERGISQIESLSSAGVFFV